MNRRTALRLLSAGAAVTVGTDLEAWGRALHRGLGRGAPLRVLDRLATGAPLGIAFIRAGHPLLGEHAQLGRLLGADSDVTAVSADIDPGAGGNRFRREFLAERVALLPGPGAKLTPRAALAMPLIEAHRAQKQDQNKHQKDFTRRDGSGHTLTRAPRSHVVVELGQTPQDEQERPPALKQLPDGEAAAQVVDLEQNSQKDQQQAAENGTSARSSIAHSLPA